MVKRKRYMNGLYIDGKLVVFTGTKWEELRKLAAEEIKNVY
ncbi:hypothetical protein [Paenibacillus naphthalenovorans]|uniref:Uncharacterized protein n=1 Tax=Paenibacillus naphthalenovorans TaxID=162209 RepID=A0A0U2MWH0_9BACL|nr:hypothetical protein [Paenibacillus naphthalenovorans]ALS22239.1 hypothetical protein IJ22_18650 [Paenibacillus naphthalenovorans]